MFDLHFHSTASDGKADIPTIAAALAAHPELRLVALADHDYLASSAELAALEPRAWVGSEILAVHGPRRVDVLALNVLPDDPALTAHIDRREGERHTRFLVTGKLLRAQGWAFDPEPEVLANPRLARPHVVAELRRQSANRERLEAAGAIFPWRSREDDNAIYDYILDPLGRTIDTETGATLCSVTDMIAMIHAAGGIAVIAHPWIAPYDQGRATKTKARRAIAEWAEAGLDGLEVFHEAQHDDAVRSELLAQAELHGLLTTAGCDDHSPDMWKLGRELAADDPRAADMLAAVLEVAAARRREVLERAA